jgi:hypothetical protein
MSKNCLHYIAAQFQEVVAISSLPFSPIEAANIMIVGVRHCTTLELLMMQDQKSFTFCWLSLWGGGSNIIAGLGEHKSCQFWDYGFKLWRTPVIIQDARPEISDAPMTLICSMGQRNFPFSFYVSSGPITAPWINVTMKHFDCPHYRTKIVYSPLTLTLETNKQSFSAHFRMLEIHTVIFDSQYTVSRDNHLHLKASWPLGFWGTTIHVISPMNNVAPLRCGAFSRYVPASRSLE